MIQPIIEGIVTHKFIQFQSRAIHTSACRLRYKKKWVEMGRKKVLPRELAMAYFDTYYPKIYGEKCWDQMRVALTKRKKKYCALVNNYANSQNTVVGLISEHEAYDMFTVTGNPIKPPPYRASARNTGIGRQDGALSDSESDEIHEDEITSTRRWDDMAIDLGDSKPASKEVEYIETPEGFMIPQEPDLDMMKPHHPPDLYDYVPAQRQVTEKEELESDLGRQALMLGAQNIVEILPADPLLVPPMLKCHVHEAGVVKTFHSPKQDDSKMLQYYLMDCASILPVIALDLRPNDRVLDMCAAPGGKALAIAQCLIADQIVCVDSSWPRLKRLRDTFRWYIPGVFNHNENIAEPVVVLHDDGRVMGDRHPDRYDKVLVDAPCNTDRQCLTDDENSRFKRTRVTERLQLPQLQTELLMSGIRSCRPGGAVVYATCTLTPGQNDYVVESAITQLRQQYPDIEVMVQDTGSIRERLNHVFKFWPGSRYGQVVLPSSRANFGPSYFAKLLRVK